MHNDTRTRPRSIHVLAELNVADALGETAQSAAELAKSVGANADALSRILRLASAHDPPTLKLRRGKQSIRLPVSDEIGEW
jgi:hypothetical protein